jgi:hypothetical protein
MPKSECGRMKGRFQGTTKFYICYAQEEELPEGGLILLGYPRGYSPRLFVPDYWYLDLNQDMPSRASRNVHSSVYSRDV